MSVGPVIDLRSDTSSPPTPGMLEAISTAALGNDMRKRLHPVIESAWARDPWSLGAYSYGSEGAQAARAVILSAGSINSPQLLQLSGIGDPALLRRIGIQPRHAAPVGRNLQDHLGINYIYRSRVPTLNNALYPLGGKIRAALEFLLHRRGPLSMSVNQGGGFIRSSHR